MRFSSALITITLSLCAAPQVPPRKDAPASEARGIPARAAPSDYQAHAEAGKFTVAAEFTEHSVPTPEATLITDEYVAVETALYGPPGEHLTISVGDFFLRINGKKSPLTAHPYGAIFSSLKDPAWEPPEQAESKSKSSISTGGAQAGGDSKPPPPKPPIELVRAWQQKVQRVALPQGDRALPQGGLIFFQYRGKSKNIESLELIYDGPAGKATLTLQP